MSETNQANDTMSDAADGQEESAVIRALRDEVKSLKGDLNDARKRAETIAESTRNEMRRLAEARQVVSDLGYPKMVDDVVEKVEGDITAESVAAFLEARGLQPKSTGEPVESTDTRAADLAGTASLGQRLADAASGAGPQGMIERLNADLTSAESAEEIAAAMAKAGLSHSR